MGRDYRLSEPLSIPQGPIQSQNGRARKSNSLPFQFHKVQFRADLYRKVVELPADFQFHKVQFRGRLSFDCPVYDGPFNSTRSNSERAGVFLHHPGALLSIPQGPIQSVGECGVNGDDLRLSIPQGPIQSLVRPSMISRLNSLSIPQGPIQSWWGKTARPVSRILSIPQGPIQSGRPPRAPSKTNPLSIPQGPIQRPP